MKEHWQTDQERLDMGCGNGHCLWSSVGNFIWSALMLILMVFYFISFYFILLLLLLFLHLVFNFGYKSIYKLSRF